MTLEDLWALKSNSLVNDTKLYGSTLKPINRIGGLQNKVSISDTAGYIARKLLDEHVPYYKSYTSFTSFDPRLETDFITELLRHLFGEVALEDSNFTRSEELFYKEFREYQLGITKTGELLIACQILNDWLVTEVLNGEHSTDYYTFKSVGLLRLCMTHHFLSELRRQLSGEIVEGTSDFSPEEEIFYNEYVEYQNEISKVGIILLACEELENWINRELMELPQHVIPRDYTITHKWRKTETRD